MWKRGSSRPHQTVRSTLQRASFKSSPQQYACPPVCIHGGVVVLARELALDTDGKVQVRRRGHRPFAALIFLRRPVRRSSASAERSWASRRDARRSRGSRPGTPPSRPETSSLSLLAHQTPHGQLGVLPIPDSILPRLGGDVRPSGRELVLEGLQRVGCPPSGAPCASRRGRCRTRAGCRRSSRRSRGGPGTPCVGTRRSPPCRRRRAPASGGQVVPPGVLQELLAVRGGKVQFGQPGASEEGVPGKPRVRVQGPALSSASQSHGDLEPIRQLTLVVLLRHSLVGSQAALEVEAQGHLADTDPPRVRHVQQIGHEGRVDVRLRRLPLGAKNRRDPRGGTPPAKHSLSLASG